MKILSHNWTGNSLVMVANNNGVTKTKIIQKSHPNWNIIVDLYKNQKYEEVYPLMDIGATIALKSDGKFTVKDGKVIFNGEEVHGYLVDQILTFLSTMPSQYQRLVKFAENLWTNPDVRIREELYKFLEHQGMPITEDGCFLAYKGVTQEYYSISSGQIKVLKGTVNAGGHIFNGVGEEIVVERESVCSNGDIGCASGLHAGSWEYANDFKSGGRLMIVKINPRDVVSVPKDSKYQKLRTCRYEVIAEEAQKLDAKADGDFDKTHKVSFHEALQRFAKKFQQIFN